jgi:hypothetical protein
MSCLEQFDAAALKCAFVPEFNSLVAATNVNLDDHDAPHASVDSNRY